MDSTFVSEIHWIVQDLRMELLQLFGTFDFKVNYWKFENDYQPCFDFEYLKEPLLFI